MPTTGFEVQSSRLLMRPWQDADRAALEQMVVDTEMMHYLTQGRAWRADEVD